MTFGGDGRRRQRRNELTVLEQVRADAQRAAIRALIRTHRDEFNDLVADELAKRGIFGDRRTLGGKPGGK